MRVLTWSEIIKATVSYKGKWSVYIFSYDSSKIISLRDKYPDLSLLIEEEYLINFDSEDEAWSFYSFVELDCHYCLLLNNKGEPITENT